MGGGKCQNYSSYHYLVTFMLCGRFFIMLLFHYIVVVTLCSGNIIM